MELLNEDLPNPPDLYRDESYAVQAACNFTISRHTARTAINQCGGDLNMALLKLLTLVEGSPVDSLCEFGGIGRESAKRYLQRASNNVEVAKNLIVQDIIVLGAASDGKHCTVKCPCCLDTFPFEETATLEACDHAFCIACVKEWISVESASNSSGEVRCPRAHECNGTLTQSELRLLLPAEEFGKLDRRALESAVLSDPTLRMCPTPDCTYIVAWTAADCPPQFDCPLCHTQRCFACGVSPYHAGQTCEDATKIKTFAHDANDANEAAEAATLCYMESSGIRVCGKCGIGVEITHGCLKMKCRCGYRFCYKCGSENARCDCTPAYHGFWDNELNKGDFSNLR